MWTRRQIMQGIGAMTALGTVGAPAHAWARTQRRPRLVLVQLRGGLDGLHAAPPWGDPDYTRARGAVALPSSGYVDLDGLFGLHMAMDALMPLWERRELALVHATAPPYRGRSHFEGQDLLQNGTTRPYGATSGWLGRAILRSASSPPGIAVSESLPLVLRGTPRTSSVDPRPLRHLDPRWLDKVAERYAQDPLLGDALTRGRNARALIETALTKRRSLSDLVAATTAIMQHDDGAPITVLELSGWDTHARQGREDGLLARKLEELASGLLQLREGLGPAWRETVVCIVTEFGRTVSANGTGGTDHGTGGLCLLAGGAVAGGTVHGKWPGLAPSALLDGRDLMPTTDLRSVFKGILRDHLGLQAAQLHRQVFPDSADTSILPGLIRRA